MITTTNNVSCPIGPNGIECSGRGQCECGQCVCTQTITTVSGVLNPLIVGDACECSNFECDTDFNRVVCSGRGLCMCSNGQYTCQCNISSLTGETHTGDACQCSSDHCIDLNNASLICNGRGRCNPCQPQGRACTCNDGYGGQYCETTFKSMLAVCTNTSTIRECVKCYGEAAEDNKHVSLVCSHLTCYNYTLLIEDPSQDNYDVLGAVNGSNVDCSFISEDCHYIYYVGLMPEGTNIYAVPPRECLPIPSWAIATINLSTLVTIGTALLLIIKCCIMYMDFVKSKRRRQ